MWESIPLSSLHIVKLEYGLVLESKALKSDGKLLKGLERYLNFTIYFNSVIGNQVSTNMILFCLLCCFTSQVNSYGHCGTISSHIYIFIYIYIYIYIKTTHFPGQG